VPDHDDRIAGGTSSVGAVFLVAPSPAMTPPDASPSTGSDPESILTIKKRVDEVNVLFIATDHHGKFVRNLNQGDFTILDDHKPPQSIINFRRETDLPLQLGLLIDTSGSCIAALILSRRLRSVSCNTLCE